MVFLISLLFLPVVVSFQLNMDLTEWDGENDIIVQHDCLHVSFWKDENDPRETISYCMGEWPSKMNIQKNNFSEEFTFDQLYELNITSQQLYLWYASMDIIEEYQSYLDQLSTLNKTEMKTYLFFNCTLPKFGSMCQYEFDNYNLSYSPFDNINFIEYYYPKANYIPNNQTCYIHLQWNLGQTSLCIGWINICDGDIQCIDGIDEEHCWQLEINECNDDEYRCKNGQCIPFSFYQDNRDSPDCLDSSDEKAKPTGVFNNKLNMIGPSFKNEVINCMKMIPEANHGASRGLCLDAYSAHFTDILLNEPSSISDNYSLAIICYLKLSSSVKLNCTNICQGESCKPIIAQYNLDVFYVPNAPIAFGHIYMAYSKDYILEQKIWNNEPEYICYDERLCNGFNSNETLYLFNNTICRRFHDFLFAKNINYWMIRKEIVGYHAIIYNNLYQCNTVLRHELTFCDNATMYQCINSSKCIAQIRLFDKKQDCDYGDDELWISTNGSCPIKNPQMYINCTQKNTCISRKLFATSECKCGEDRLCNDDPAVLTYIKEHISFTNLCNRYKELEVILTDNGEETDETECEQWPCNNIYTQCNGILNCLNGEDEVDCYPSSLIKCSLPSYVCFSHKTSTYICLSIDQINDGKFDCLGGLDETEIYRTYAEEAGVREFYCESAARIIYFERSPFCDRNPNCPQLDDEKFCDKINYSNPIGKDNTCATYDASVRSDVEEFLCTSFKARKIQWFTHFSLGRIIKHDTNKILPSSLTVQVNLTKHYTCHHGLTLRTWLNDEKNQTKMTCLCPLNYYGDKCQYQNELVSLTVQFRSYSDSWQTPFIVIISLIDDSDERIIHSHEQLTYIPIPNCKTKYNIDLLYSIRPKNQSRKYSIHIDIYEKLSTLYRGSLLIPLSFPFLPVQRVAIILDIPHSDHDLKSCSIDKCIHGECIRYFNDLKHSAFCKCHSGWSGRYCTISYTSTCASDSLSVGILANNRSICVCPLQKWGSRCFLHDQVCEFNSTCHNGGQCIPIDRYVISKKKFACICSQGYYGERCEEAQNKIKLSFEKDITLPETMLIHYIEVRNDASPNIGATFKTIPINRNPVTIYWSRPFHIAFTEFVSHKYYLIVVQNVYNQSKTIEKLIKSSDRCPHIRELFNETFIQMHLIRRIKYYHLPCRNHSLQLSCFYDDIHMCLCNDFNQQRQANCFEFNHTLKRDCRGRSNCRRGGQCLQDSVDCPEHSMCICPICSYGLRCQFSSNGFSLSLDAIVGDHIQPHINIVDQPIIVQVSITLSVLITVTGLISGIFSLITFNNKDLCKVGCGIYLFCSSVVTLLITILVSMKFWILLGAQMTYMTNKSFLYIHCLFIDYFLKVGLNMNQWLNACVAIERAFTVIKEINFDRKKSRKLAKYIIPVLLLLTISTDIHDPIHRSLIDYDNNDEKRIWCIVEYSSNIQIYDSVVNTIHFCIPFLINLISAMIVIIKTTRLRISVQTQHTYKTLLIEQFQQHKHLLISTFLLIIFTMPRLVIIFASGCMKSSSDSWLFLIGYFISFIPPMLIFIIFIVPSKIYKQEFNKTVTRYRNTVHKRFQRLLSKRS